MLYIEMPSDKTVRWLAEMANANKRYVVVTSPLKWYKRNSDLTSLKENRQILVVLLNKSYQMLPTLTELKILMEFLKIIRSSFAKNSILLTPLERLGTQTKSSFSARMNSKFWNSWNARIH